MEKKYSKFLKKHFVNSLYYYERGSSSMKKNRPILLYPSEIISINDFAPCGSLEPLSLLISVGNCSKLIIKFSSPTQELHSCLLQALTSSTRSDKNHHSSRGQGSQAGRQDVPDLFLTCWTGGRKKLGVPLPQDSWEVMAGESDARFSGSFRLAVFKQQVVTHCWVLKSF